MRITAVATALVGCCTFSLPGLASPEAASTVEAVNLRVERQVSPLGIDAARPRLSWMLRAQHCGSSQTAYQIRIASNESGFEREGDRVWDSGKIASSDSIELAYSGPRLKARNRYYWQVRIWDERGLASKWSAPAWWEMGLLSPTEWTAQWITVKTVSEEALLFRREFTTHGRIERARAYVTAHGLYQLFFNGERVGDAEFRPGFTSYNRRLQYQTYDVTGLLRSGRNAVGAMVGAGWYRGKYAYDQRDFYGSDAALLVQIEIDYADGTSARVTTDGQWKASTGPIIASNLYDGETYDARLEQPGWDRSSFDESRWSSVQLVEVSKSVLVAQEGASVRVIEQLRPKGISRRPDGRVIVDMGQNMAGRVSLEVQGPAGTAVTLRHGEVLTPAGDLYTENLMGAEQTVRYILKGHGIEHYEPHFTFQGFRYVEVSGYPGELTPEKISAQVLHSDLAPTGEFVTSNPLLNQLQHNIVWSMKSNFLEIPTDNPQRAERVGWTGDAQLFAPTAAFNADVALFFTKWLKDLAADQSPQGSLPWTIPDAWRGEREKAAAVNIGREMPVPPRRQLTDDPEDRPGVAVWGDAAVLVPWSMYLAYGDRRILENQYASMVRWVEYERGRAGEDLIWDGDFQFADWLDFGAETRKRHGATSADLVATAYFAHSVDVLSKAARILAKDRDAARYAQLFEQVRAAFQRRFVTAEALVGEGTQTAQVLALQFDLLPQKQRAAAARLLAEDVRRRGCLTTGLAGVSWLLFALSDNGYLDEAYQILLREDYPSWLYQVKRGATTIWERWDSIMPDGSIQTESGMNSFNQYVYGSVGTWMYRTISGLDIDPAAPGYKHILIRPRPGGGLTEAKASHMTPYGMASSTWQLDAENFQLNVEIPPNTTASVTLPFARERDVREGGKPVRISKGIVGVKQTGSGVAVEIGSGRYTFSYAMKNVTRP